MPGGQPLNVGATGKLLPFKDYGATGNAMAYGLKEG